MKLGIVGNGVVGSCMARFFSLWPSHSVIIYDKFQPGYDGDDQKGTINTCDVVFIAVPTPASKDGSCDLSAVEECVGWITAPICIRSTVTPGTVDRLVAESGKAIAFSPEYIGEHPSHPWREESACGFLILGGPSSLRDVITTAYSSIPSSQLAIYHTTAREAELCKYMENCFLATKVAFMNQFYDIAHALDVDFENLRRLWLLDPRIGPSHSSVTPERGFRGRCVPKDIAAIVAAMKAFGGAPLLESIMDYNTKICANADEGAHEAGLLCYGTQSEMAEAAN